jgi:hypothetical protein
MIAETGDVLIGVITRYRLAAGWQPVADFRSRTPVSPAASPEIEERSAIRSEDIVLYMPGIEAVRGVDPLGYRSPIDLKRPWTMRGIRIVQMGKKGGCCLSTVIRTVYG